MTSWRDRIQALKPDETEVQGHTRGGWGSFTRPEGQGQGQGQGQGGWGAFSREPKNQGIAISQAVKAAEDSAVAKAAIAEKRKYEEAVNLSSEKAYPSLGATAPAPKTSLNFREVVKAALAKEEEEAEAAEQNEDEEPLGKEAKAPLKSFQHFMESFEDDDDDDDDDEGEFNADIVQNRRRGDKGIW